MLVGRSYREIDGRDRKRGIYESTCPAKHTNRGAGELPVTGGMQEWLTDQGLPCKIGVWVPSSLPLEYGLASDFLDLNPSSTTYLPCDLGQLASPLISFPICKMEGCGDEALSKL